MRRRIHNRHLPSRMYLRREQLQDDGLHFTAQKTDLRAMSATEAKRQGLDPQLLLGHTDARTTRIYLRSRDVPVVRGPKVAK